MDKRPERSGSAGTARGAELDRILNALREYDGPECTIMEVCGTHTASIVQSGIPSLLSPHIHLISGPGCPVCVTVTAYIDRLTELALDGRHVVCCFGDLMRVRGREKSLLDAKAQGGNVQMVYSPMDMLEKAAEDGRHIYVFAAVGFETTMPVYALLIQEAKQKGLSNVRLLTSLKTMPPVIRWLGERNTDGRITGFLAPGHVCAVTGWGEYESLARDLGLPFVVSGFTAEALLTAIYGLVRLRGKAEVRNFYPQAVSREGNRSARESIAQVFETRDAAWRGMGVIEGSGCALRRDYAEFDAGSDGLHEDCVPDGCCCPQILMGKMEPADCPLFGKACTPAHPQGSCMVSQEGSCYNHFICSAPAIFQRESTACRQIHD